MNYYMAPLEGITGFVLRNAVNTYFGEGIDRFFSPFVMPHEKHVLTEKELRDIAPAHNVGFCLIPQIMTNSVEGFDRLIVDIKALGYEEVNFNLGCPSGTVTSRGRGAGFLKDKFKLEQFLDDIYSDNPDLKMSIKTRIGYADTCEWEELLEIYHRFPISELIVHPRIGVEKYNGTPHLPEFCMALERFEGRVIYNGDICSVSDAEVLSDRCEKETGRTPDGIMIGRGMLMRPSLIRECVGGRPFDNKELTAFLDQICTEYRRNLFGDAVVLNKMKEIWIYLKRSFPENEKETKKILKAKNYEEYDRAVKTLLE